MNDKLFVQYSNSPKKNTSSKYVKFSPHFYDVHDFLELQKYGK